MHVETRTPLQSLNPAYRKEKVRREAIDRLKRELPLFLDRSRGKVGESTLRDHLQTLLRGVAYPAEEFLVQSEVRRMDTVIHDGPKRKHDIGVIVEAKTATNVGEMFTPAKPNVKSLHELVLYFMRERLAGNTAVKNLVITDGDALYVMADREFERLFWDKKRFRKKILDADADPGKNNDLIYAAVREHVDALDDALQVTETHLRDFRKFCEDDRSETDAGLIPLYKLLSPEHLLRRPFAGDSNHLDKGFYRELLHLIGLHEVSKKNGKVVKSGGKKVIERLPAGQRHPASLLENTLQVAAKENRFRHVRGLTEYGSDEEERRFAVTLELCLTWVNRILFLKLLETQLLSYHRGDKAYRFLTSERIPDFDALNTLFFDVLNKPVARREAIVSDFARVPYLNSSLFEISALEDQVLRVNSLKDQFGLALAPSSVLRTRGPAHVLFPNPSPQERGVLPPLDYLFRFLDAYDFGGEGRARIQEDNKRLINASVLGLIFEKINGYRDGSFYTPGFITEYMCRQTIRRAVVRKFRDDDGPFADFDAEDFDALRNYLQRDGYRPAVRLAANALVNSLTVCDPAVGSGHFLVSALNELIATKSALGILGAAAGARAVDVVAEVENDELLVSWRDGEPYDYFVDVDSNGRIKVPSAVQEVQQTLFHEKRTLIENCLFGVDLNPNSVKICRLRLWIELLKNAYYVLPDERSEQSRADERSEQSRADERSEQSRADERSEQSRPPSPSERGRGRGLLQTLPNIDINIKQGNSLISRFALDDDLSGALKDSDLRLDDYRRAVTDYHRAQGRDSKQRLLDLIERIKGNFQTHIGRNDKRVQKLANARGKLTQLQSLLEMGDLFGSVDEKKVRKEIKPVRQQVDKLEAELTGIRENAIYQQAFEWRFEFPAVLGEDGGFEGFDVVVGNPPYVRIQDIPSEHADYYGIAFKSAGKGNYDLYVPFVELATYLIADMGIANYIIPHKFSDANYGKALREYISSNTLLDQVLHFGAAQVFSDATTYTGLFWFSRDTDKANVDFAKLEDLSIRLENIDFNKIPYSLIGQKPWNYISGKEAELFLKIEGVGKPLGEACERVFQGLKTSYDKIYILDVTDETGQSYSVRSPHTDQEYSFSKTWVKKLIKGGDSRAYSIDWSQKVIIFPYQDGQLSDINKIKIQDLNLYNYLLSYEKELRNREKGKMNHDEWYGYVYPKALTLMDRVKLFTPDIAPKPRYSFDFNGEYFFTGGTSGGYGLLSTAFSKEFLLGILNSKVHDWYIRKTSTQMRGGWYSFESKYISKFTIPINQSNELSSLVSQILTQKSTDPTADTSALEAEIDVLVYQLYGLTYAEVLVVDEGFGMSEEAYGKVGVG